MKGPLDNSKYDYSACSIVDILRIVLIYRLIHWPKRLNTDKFPSLKCVFYAFIYHYTWFIKRLIFLDLDYKRKLQVLIKNFLLKMKSEKFPNNIL